MQADVIRTSGFRSESTENLHEVQSIQRCNAEQDGHSVM
jgi:hypothetical protein